MVSSGLFDIIDIGDNCFTENEIIEFCEAALRCSSYPKPYRHHQHYNSGRTRTNNPLMLRFQYNVPNLDNLIGRLYKLPGSEQIVWDNPENLPDAVLSKARLAVGESPGRSSCLQRGWQYRVLEYRKSNLYTTASNDTVPPTTAKPQRRSPL